MSKGTIIYVGGFELPDKNAAAHRVMANGKVFRALGYRVAFLGVNHSEPCFPGIRQASYGEDIYEEAQPRNNRQWLVRLCSTTNLQKLASEYDDLRMIILYNLPYETLRRVRKSFRGQKVKIVYDCTEWSPDTDGSLAKRLFKRIDSYAIRHWLPNCADGLIVVSQRMLQAYANRNYMLLLPPLVDLDDPIWHQSRTRNENVFEFCFAGILDSNKESLDVVIRAFCLLKHDNIRLRIIGISEQDFHAFYPDFQNDFAQQNEKIYFMGRLSHRETVGYILKSNCYIFIRQSDLRNNAGFPTKFVEAYTCGIPIITTDVSDIRTFMTSIDKGEVLTSIGIQPICQAMADAADRYATRAVQPALETTFHFSSWLPQTQAWLDAMHNL
jgi:glycosyltransferase involved in cell wall biosynthesis